MFVSYEQITPACTLDELDFLEHLCMQHSAQQHRTCLTISRAALIWVPASHMPLSRVLSSACTPPPIVQYVPRIALLVEVDA